MADRAGRSEVLFLFNDRDRAEAAGEAARRLGHNVRVKPGDGEARYFQLRLRLDRALPTDELDRLVEDELRPLMARHRGRYEGSSTEWIN